MTTLAEFDAATVTAGRRAELEYDLIVGLLQNPKRGMELARAAELESDDFDQPDLQLIYVALEFAHDNPHVKLMLAVRFALQFGGYWVENVLRGSRGMQHGPASLAYMVYGTFPCPALIPSMLLELKGHAARARGKS